MDELARGNVNALFDIAWNCITGVSARNIKIQMGARTVMITLTEVILVSSPVSKYNASAMIPVVVRRTTYAETCARGDSASPSS